MERVVTVTKTVIEKPALPPVPAPLVFYEDSISGTVMLNMANIYDMLEQIDEGDREPFNHVCITPETNEIARRNDNLILYKLKEYQAWVEEVLKRHKD